MKANELRVGNFVYDIRGEQNIQCNLKFMTQAHDRLYAIELNEEWLIKFGFEKIYCHHFGDYEYHKFINGSEYLVWFTDYSVSIGGSRDEISKGFSYCSYGVIKYAHQLQNLYFALTGEELNKNEL